MLRGKKPLQKGRVFSARGTEDGSDGSTRTNAEQFRRNSGGDSGLAQFDFCFSVFRRKSRPNDHRVLHVQRDTVIDRGNPNAYRSYCKDSDERYRECIF